MVLEGLRGYIQLASGLTDVTRDRARAVVKSVLAQGEAGVGVVVPTSVRAQVGALTDDLLATSRANRDLLLNLVRAEVERSVARLGLVSGQELAAASRRSASLERRVEELEDELHRSRSATRSPATATARKSTAQKSATTPAKRIAGKTAKKTAKTATTSTGSPSAASTSDPTSTGATSTGPSSTGPSSTGPTSTGPSSTGASSTGASSTGATGSSATPPSSV